MHVYILDNRRNFRLTEKFGGKHGAAMGTFSGQQ